MDELKPPPMSEGKIQELALEHLLAYADFIDSGEVWYEGEEKFAHALIAARDAQWLSLVGELQRDAEMGRQSIVLFAQLLDQLGERDRGDGNAPGHCHEIPGIWDSDNGKKAGKQCAWCATWNEAKRVRTAIDAARSEKGGV